MNEKATRVSTETIVGVWDTDLTTLSMLWNTREFRKAIMLQAKGPIPYANVTCTRAFWVMREVLARSSASSDSWNLTSFYLVKKGGVWKEPDMD